ncbi:MAG: insulinase family protein [Calditrichaeota bacterium]|nr:insulinase family protein [Calditrichota bacterium]RQV92592.1 MAG: insulinase family protein [bacterium]RQW07590.1 MAG: insulinase family protein [Calditrichota bacterium]
MVYSQYKKTILSNGLTVVSEKIPYVRSVSIGAWIKSGTRQEEHSDNGIAHFLEHMIFKGTERRSAREIARSLESVGGYLNAFTSKEQTCYYAEILDTQLSRAIDVLSDMLCHSVFSPREMEKEREVILDEIDSLEDTPDDLVQDVFVEKLYPENSLGFSILGTRESVGGISREQLIDFYRRHYTMQNMVIAAAGNLDHQQLIDMCQRKFQLPDGNGMLIKNPPARIGHGEYIIKRSVNQTHICFGTSALPYKHQQKYELLLLNTVLGVGMGSRLFQNIRERYGVAYSIYSFVDFYSDNGLLAIYLGTEKNKKDLALRLIEKELNRLKTKPLSNSELKRIKAQLKGNLFLGLENTSKRMSRLAKMEIYLNEFQSVDKIINDIDKVTSESIFNLVNEIFQEEQMLNIIFLPN